MGTTLLIVAASIVFSIGIAVVVLKQAGVFGPRKKVLASGVAGQATIMGVSPTGTVINEINYVCKFQLRVSVPGRDTYDVETKETVAITSMGALVPGTQVSVKVDQQDPTRVFIDWSAGIVPAGAAAAAARPRRAPATSPTRCTTGPLRRTSRRARLPICCAPASPRPACSSRSPTPATPRARSATPSLRSRWTTRCT